MGENEEEEEKNLEENEEDAKALPELID